MTEPKTVSDEDEQEQEAAKKFLEEQAERAAARYSMNKGKDKG